MDPCNNRWNNTKHLEIFRRTSNTNYLVGVSQKGSPEPCRFRFFPFFFRFLSVFFVFFRFFLFFPFSSVFFRFFRFLPFFFFVSFPGKKRGDAVRETLFAKPRFRGRVQGGYLINSHLFLPHWSSSFSRSSSSYFSLSCCRFLLPLLLNLLLLILLVLLAIPLLVSLH